MAKPSERLRHYGSRTLGRQTWPVDPRPRLEERILPFIDNHNEHLPKPFQ